jgi:predicted cytidylate kinase
MIITLGGRAGSGKSSVGKEIAKKLGFEFYSAGDVRREYAKKNNKTLEELNKLAEKDPSSDYLVDDYMKAMAYSGKDFVIDAWLGFHFFQDSLKLFFDADPLVRAKRIFERGHSEEISLDVNAAFKLMTERENNSARRYEKLYGVNIYDLSNYDHVIDTTKNAVSDTVKIVLDYIK